MFFDEKKLKIVPGVKKHAYSITVLTRRFFPYVNFSFETVMERLAANQIKYFVAEYEGHTMGFADVEFMNEKQAKKNMNTTETEGQEHQNSNQTKPKPKKIAKLLGLAVAPEFQGHGIGKKLLGKVLALAKKKASKAFILVAEDNAGALKMYVEHGFEKQGTLDRQLGGKTILLLKKTL